MTRPKLSPGDRVRVTFEGTVEKVKFGSYVRDTIGVLHYLSAIHRVRKLKPKRLKYSKLLDKGMRGEP